MEPKVLEETPVTMAELRAEVDRIKKRDIEPNIRVTKMEDYLNSFSTLNASKEKELIEAVRKLKIPRLKDEHIYKIADLQPKNLDDLKMIMQGYIVSISADNMKKIVDAVTSVLKKS